MTRYGNTVWNTLVPREQAATCNRLDLETLGYGPNYAQKSPRTLVLVWIGDSRGSHAANSKLVLVMSPYDFPAFF